MKPKSSIAVHMKNGEVIHFSMTGRDPLFLEYQTSVVLVKDSNKKETAYPVADVEQIISSHYEYRSW